MSVCTSIQNFVYQTRLRITENTKRCKENASWKTDNGVFNWIEKELAIHIPTCNGTALQFIWGI